MSEIRSTASTTLVEVLEEAAVRFADTPAHQFLATREAEPAVTTFRDLVRRSSGIAASIRDRVAPGRPVLVVTPPSTEFLPALAACFRLGSPAVPLYPPRPGLEADGVAWISRVAGLCDAALVLAPVALVPLLREHRVARADGTPLEVVPLDAPTEAGPPWDRRSEDRSVVAETPALLLFTSGSTGAPKGVVLTHGNLVGNIAEFVRGARLGSADAMVTWLPNGHIAGLYTRLVGQFTGATTVEFPAPLFLERPAFWARTIARFGASISAAPNFAYDLLASVPPAELAGVRLDRWRLAISGGEVVRPATFRALADTLGPCGFQPAALTPYYGLTETLCSAVRLSPDPGQVRLSRAGLERHRAEDAPADATDALEFLGNGPALGSTRLAIVDPATRRGLAEDHVGEIWVGGAAVTPGYLHQETLNAEVVRAVRADGTDGTWFRTGDLGFLRAGTLYVTGRLKEMVIVRGKNYYPADIEHAALSALSGHGVAVCAAFGLDLRGEEQVALALELARGTDATSADPSALAALAQSGLVRVCGVACGAVVVVPFGSLPRTATGKVQRGRCRSLLESGQWKPVGAAAASASGPRPDASVPSPPLDPAIGPFVEWLRTEIAIVTGRTPGSVDVSLPLPALGVDSLGMVRLLAAMEIRFAAGVGIGRMLSAASVVELARGIEAGRPEAVEPVDFAAEQKGFTDRLASFRPGSRPPGPPRTVLLTGATGFLGAYLLRDLLGGSESRVRCLVRGSDAADGLRRLLRKLESIPGWNPAWERRLEVVHGSLDSPGFGLSQDAFRALAADTDLIVHNGANVNFVAPYPLLRAVNVTSNLAVLDLALAGGGLPVHYVSTTAVFNGPDRDRFPLLDEEAFLPGPSTLFSGYAQTKWVSEALWRVAKGGGLPVAVHRPGLVTGDASTGVWHTDDFLCRLFKGCLQIGAFPDLEVGIDMIPVDVVSRGIVAAVVGGGHGRAYHWTHPAPVRLRAIAGWFAANGWEALALPVGEWLARIRTVDESNALYPLLPFLLQRIGPGAESILEFFGRRSLNLGRSNAAALAEAGGFRCPDPLAELLPLYAGHLVDTGYLPSPSVSVHPSANP